MKTLRRLLAASVLAALTVLGYSPVACSSLPAAPLHPPTFTLAAPIEVAVPVGGDRTFSVEIKRDDTFDGVVLVNAEGLPAGVTAAPLRIDAGASTGTLSVHAATTVPVGQKPFTVHAVSGDQDKSARTLLAVGITSGVVDPTFGDQGLATSVVPDRFYITGLVVGPDDSTYAPGHREGPTDFGAVIKLGADGRPDAHFGTAGLATIPQENANPLGITFQPDGKLLVWGSRFGADARGDFTSSPAVWRLDAAGALDPTFGTGGTFELATRFDGQLGAAALRPDGSIDLLSVPFAPAGLPIVRLLRVTSGGTLDPTFGTGGVVRLDNVSGGFRSATGGWALLHAAPSATEPPFVEVVDATGAPDPTFASGAPIPLDATLGIDRGFVAPDGGLLLVGCGTTCPNLVHVHTDGTLDPAFGTGGVVETPVPGTFPFVINATQEGPNHLLVSYDFRPTDNTVQVVVRRFDLATGATDLAFADQGELVVEDLIGPSDVGYNADTAVDSMGRVLLGVSLSPLDVIRLTP